MAQEVAVSVNVDTFVSRLEALQSHLTHHKNDLYGGASILMAVHGKMWQGRAADEPHAVCLQKLLLGYEFPETIMLITPTDIFVNSSGKKLAYLEASAVAVKAKYGEGRKMHLVLREKAEAYQKTVNQLLDAVRAVGGPVGHFPSDWIEGSEQSTTWTEAVKALGLGMVDATGGVEAFLAVKDGEAIRSVNDAGALASRVGRNVFVTEMESVIDSEREVTNAELAMFVEKSLDALPKYNINLDTDHYDIMVKPIVQSGGAYNIHVLREDAACTGADFKFDAIIFSLGMKYKNFGAFVARTYFVDPSPSQMQVYSALLDAQHELIEALRPGRRISEICSTVRDSLLAKEGVPLEAKMPKTFGHGFGLRANEKYIALSVKNEAIVEEGMVFVVNLGFSEITLNDAIAETAMAKLNTYAVLIGDTVVVGRDETKSVTDKMKKDKGEVSYSLAENEKNDAPVADVDYGGGIRSTRLAARRADMELDDEAKKRREEHQSLLFEKKKEAAKRALRGGAAAGAGKEEEDLTHAGVIEAYKSTAEYPRGIRPTALSVDKAHDCVLVPIFGTLVPYHISTIKSVVKTEEGHKAFLRLNFYAPGSAPGKDAAPAMLAAMALHPSAIYVKTLNFMSKDHRNMSNLVNLIKAMQKKIKTEREAEKQRADLVEQAKLILAPKGGKVPSLQELSMWPPLSGRKTRGTLEAHTNGLRFMSEKSSSEKVDIIYSNIRHGIFQPCEAEHVVLIHFHLKNAILIGKKKYKDVQFFTEVVEASQAIDGRHRSDFDADEMAEEERERKVRNEMNKAFRRFVERVQEIAEKDPGGFRSFDIPTSELRFTGAPFREMVNIYPCADCLVSLVDKPPFVASVDDIEHVHFERVTFTNKAFDMVLVFKAGTRDKGEDEFIRISSIPMPALEGLRSWLDSVAELTYTESVGSFNWKGIIEDYVRDEAFYLSNNPETGSPKPAGWDFLRDDKEEEEEEDEDSSEYSEEDEEADEEEEEDDDDEFDELVSDEESEEDYEEEDDDEGEDWDELDKKAEMADHKRKRQEDEDEEREAKKAPKAKKARRD